jgi:DNA (cytosine-5)-methyltransferase 1
MKKEQIARKKESELREIYNNIKATYNLVNIQQVHAKDLGMVNRDDYNYILTYSFPCQDLSLAGKGAGMEKGSGTRSGMLWEVERILEECEDELPQLLLMENVPQVVGTKNKADFDKWLEFLESKGYTNKYCMLNAKEVGYPEPIPQNRNRCFMISVLNPKCDIVFPGKTERTMVLKDLLEENVDEKYYLSEKQIESVKGWNAY